MTGFIEVVSRVKGHGASGARYEVLHNGEVLLESCRVPLYDAARALLPFGVDPDDILIMTNEAGMPCMQARIGYAAAHTVTEGNNYGPRVVKWVPYNGPEPKED